MLQSVQIGHLVFLKILSGEIGVFERIFIIDDIFEKFVSVDFSVIAEGVDQSDGFAVLCNSDNSIGDEFYFVGLEVESQIQSKITWLIAEYPDTYLILYYSNCRLIKF